MSHQFKFSVPVKDVRHLIDDEGDIEHIGTFTDFVIDRQAKLDEKLDAVLRNNLSSDIDFTWERIGDVIEFELSITLGSRFN